MKKESLINETTKITIDFRNGFKKEYYKADQVNLPDLADQVNGYIKSITRKNDRYYKTIQLLQNAICRYKSQMKLDSLFKSILKNKYPKIYNEVVKQL